MIRRVGKGPKRPEERYPQCPPELAAAANRSAARHFVSGANGIRTRDLLLAKKPV